MPRTMPVSTVIKTAEELQADFDKELARLADEQRAEAEAAFARAKAEADAMQAERQAAYDREQV